MTFAAFSLSAGYALAGGFAGPAESVETGRAVAPLSILGEARAHAVVPVSCGLDMFAAQVSAVHYSCPAWAAARVARRVETAETRPGDASFVAVWSCLAPHLDYPAQHPQTR